MKHVKYIIYNLLLLVTVSIGTSCSKESTGTATANSTIGKGGSLSKFAIVGSHLYAVDNFSLYTYDINNPSNPVQVSNLNLGSGIETIYAYNNQLFIGSTTGMFIYSLANPSSPAKLGSASHVRSCDPVVANDSIAFVTLKGGTSCGPAISGLYVYDVRNLLQPALLNTIEIPSPEGLGLQGAYLYVCCNDEGLKVFNVSNPHSPAAITTVTGAYFKDVIPYGNLLICYISTGIMLYDISDPANPVAIKQIQNT